MVKPLSFKGDKKAKKRKRVEDAGADGRADERGLVPAAEQDEDNEDMAWVSADAPADISGPVLLVLPTSPPTALASDAHGKVFVIAIENIDPSLNPASAEPHDVRQVWIANRVAGTEHVSLKAQHGKYLGCNQFGELSASRGAISMEESWTVVPTPEVNGAFSLQTQREKFLSVEQDESAKSVEAGSKPRGDVEEIGFTTTVRIRMQARFKPKLKIAKADRAREKISRKELEDAVGRRLEDDEVKMLKRARRDGGYHEALLDVKVKGKHDKFA